MPFPQPFLDALVERNPIEEVVGQYVTLTRKGSNLFGLCPFHSEKTGSFSVAPEKGIYYCFGCHKGGGVINFIMEIESLSYPDAVRFLAKRAGLEVPEDEEYRAQYKRTERLYALCKDAARWFRKQLLADAGREARDYIVKRGLSTQTVNRFGLGFSPNEWSALMDAMQKQGYTQKELLDAGLAVNGKKGGVYDRFRNRLMFPIIDIRGNVIGFGGRVMDDSTPKYLNSPETIIFNKRRNLFAMNVVKKSKREFIILTEGYMDAIALHQYGFDCAVASLGTSLTQEHADMLSKYTDELVLTYDGDEAGQNATQRAIPMLERTGLRVRILRMRGAKDPDEFLKKYGADRFRLLLEGCENQAEYRLRSLQMRFDLSQDEQKVEFAKQAAALIAGFGTAVEREVYGTRAAEAAGLSPDVLRMEIDRARKRLLRQEKREETRREMDPAAAVQPFQRELRYDNVRSAVAEEGLLRMLFREPALLAQTEGLTAEDFSVPLFGRVYAALRERWQNDLAITPAALADSLSPAEMAHLTAVLQKQEPPLSETALADYLRILREERAKARVSDASDLLAMQRDLKKKKGYGGS